jgi:hypothetical protein
MSFKKKKKKKKNYTETENMLAPETVAGTAEKPASVGSCAGPLSASLFAWAVPKIMEHLRLLRPQDPGERPRELLSDPGNC